MKTWIAFLLFLPLLLLSSCFEIVEEVNMNQDGSGTLTLTINANQSKEQLDKIMAKDSLYNFKVPSRQTIDGSISEVSGKLKSIKGISNVSIARDFQTYILVIKCSFSNTHALNAAINNIWLLYDKKAAMDKTYFAFSNNVFKRTFDYELIKNVKSKLGAQERDILHRANYTMVYRFQTEIIHHTNTSATLSKSQKAIILKNNLLDIISGKKSIQNEIKLK